MWSESLHVTYSDRATLFFLDVFLFLLFFLFRKGARGLLAFGPDRSLSIHWFKFHRLHCSAYAA